MFEKIEIRGFRHFSGYVVPADGLTVFCGRNGTGKSSIATAFQILAAVAGRYLSDWTEVFGNTEALFHEGAERSTEIVLSIHRDKECYVCVLARDPKDPARLILTREKLVVADPQNGSRVETMEVKTGERESIFGVPVDPKGGGATALMREMSRWWIGHLVMADIRHPAKNDSGRRLYPTGQNLEACILYLAEKAPAAFLEIQMTIASVEPDFLQFVVVGKGDAKKLMWERRSRSALMPLQYFSEGTLRLICYATLFVSVDLPEVMVIDDVETALDEDHIRALMRLAVAAGERTNVILTTRSEVVAGCAGQAVRRL